MPKHSIILSVFEDALHEAIPCYEIIKDTAADNPIDMPNVIMLAFIFEQCGNTKMTVIAMLRYIEKHFELLHIASKSSRDCLSYILWRICGNKQVFLKSFSLDTKLCLQNRSKSSSNGTIAGEKG
ncbi:MAG TPA: hypothetical protein DCP92_08055 [Nitrospiraceae bacterium]|nr:hypothetical protein [Nitrospiraceae bacterium]